jgi:hypothetical protein
MDGQLTFKALTDEATGATVRQINVTNLKDALKLMDASLDKWGKSLDAFVDAWLTKASLTTSAAHHSQTKKKLCSLRQ